MTVKIELEQDRCIAAGNCVILSPEVFDQRDEDGVVVTINSDPPEEMREDIRAAAASCPANVIRVG